MVSKEATVIVNALILPNGEVKFLDSTDKKALETEIRQWNNSKGDEHEEFGTYGGVVQCRMLAKDWFKMKKEFKQDE